MRGPYLTGRVKVELTRAHITDADRTVASWLSRECNCPVAHAVTDAGFANPKVSARTFTAGDATGYLHSKGKRWRYVLPFEAQRFIERFDDNRPVEPITFEIDADDCVEVLYE